MPKPISLKIEYLHIRLDVPTHRSDRKKWVRKIVKSWDEDGSGELEINEIHNVFSSVYSDWDSEASRMIFECIDFNDSGSINVKELEYFFEVCIALTLDDPNQEYYVSKEHFRVGMARLYKNQGRNKHQLIRIASGSLEITANILQAFASASSQ